MKLRKTVLGLIFSVFVLSLSVTAYAEEGDASSNEKDLIESEEKYRIFASFGGDRNKKGDWEYQFYGGAYPEGMSGSEAEIGVGDTVTVSISFDKKPVNVWCTCPILIGEGIKDAEFTVKTFINGKEVKVNSDAGPIYWYESSGIFSETEAVRLYGGYNEWGTKYIKSPSKVTEIAYEITAVSIKVEKPEPTPEPTPAPEPVKEAEVIVPEVTPEPVLENPFSADDFVIVSERSELDELHSELGTRAIISAVVLGVGFLIFIIIEIIGFYKKSKIKQEDIGKDTDIDE